MTTRRTILKGAGATLLAAPFVSLARPARSADFSLKWAMSFVNTDPIAIYAAQAAENIKTRTDGAVEIQVFPDSQLGNDSDLLSQVRSGAIDLYSPSPFTIAQLVASAAAAGLPFTMSNASDVVKVSASPVMETIDADFQKVGIKSVSSLWTAGIRQVTNNVRPIERPEDLQGLKIRVPTSPIMIALFTHFGSAPVAMNVSELYLALQTKLVDAQENPLIVIRSRNFNEVQTYCSMTKHIFGTCFQVASLKTWPGIPADMQAIIVEEINAAAALQRAEADQIDAKLEGELEALGMKFNKPDPGIFQKKLISGNFYGEIKDQIGAEVFTQLEDVVGRLT